CYASCLLNDNECDLFAQRPTLCYRDLVAFCGRYAGRVVRERLAPAPLVPAILRVIVKICSLDRDGLRRSGACDNSFEDSSSDRKMSVEWAEGIVASCFRGFDVQPSVANYH